MAITLLDIIGTITGKLAFERSQANFTTLETEVNGHTESINDLGADVVAHKAEIASEIQKGHIELATVEEVAIGVDQEKAVTPATAKVELDKKLDKIGGSITGNIQMGDVGTISALLIGGHGNKIHRRSADGALVIESPQMGIEILNQLYIGYGSPEGVVTATIGAMYQRKDGGANTSLYIKESGEGNVGG